MEKLLIDNLKN